MSNKRWLKIASMGASIAGQTAKSTLKGLTGTPADRDQAREELLTAVGLQMAETLGQMKGAAMKVGQIASQYQDVFPPPIINALQKLQNAAPPMPYSTIEQQLISEFGKPVNELFASFDSTPFAAASIGQVHRATLPTGEAVVVKVQYPDIEPHINSDLKQIRLALRLTGLLNIDKARQEQVFTEIQTSLLDELDYQKEAQNLAIFAHFHRDDNGLIIPTVYPSHSSRRVLTLSEETGEPLAVAATWDNAIKQKIAERLFRFSAGQLFHLYRLHCDPHAGNFAFRPDGSVVAYDFGGIKSYSHETVAQFEQLAIHALQGRTAELEQDLIRLGVKKPDSPALPAQFYEDWLKLGVMPYGFSEPFDLTKHTDFDFGTSDIHKQAIIQAKASLKYWNMFQPSPELLMLERTITGQYWNLVQLGVKVDLSVLIKDYIRLKGLP